MLTFWQQVLSIVVAAVPVAALLGAVHVFFVRVTIKTEINEANAKQLAEFRETFVLALDSKITGAEIQRQLESAQKELAAIHHDVTELGQYAHTKIHELNKTMQLFVMVSDSKEFQEIVEKTKERIMNDLQRGVGGGEVGKREGRVTL